MNIRKSRNFLWSIILMRLSLALTNGVPIQEQCSSLSDLLPMFRQYKICSALWVNSRPTCQKHYAYTKSIDTPAPAVSSSVQGIGAEEEMKTCSNCCVFSPTRVQRGLKQRRMNFNIKFHVEIRSFRCPPIRYGPSNSNWLVRNEPRDHRRQFWLNNKRLHNQQGNIKPSRIHRDVRRSWRIW